MGRPFVCVNMAMTADGKITSTARQTPAFSSRRDRVHMDRLRAMADAVVVGAGTLRTDNPPLHLRDPEMIALRRSQGKPDGLLRVVVTATLRLDVTTRFFSEPTVSGRVIATVEQAPAPADPALVELAEIWRLGRRRVDVAALLSRMHAQGVERVLVEGGAELNWCFFSAGLVDELYVTLCPSLLGGSTAPTPIGGDGLDMADRIKLELLEARTEEGEVFCHYRVL